VTRHDTPTDPYCKRAATDIPSLVSFAKEVGETANDIAMQDGTYNPDTNEFCCDDCYVELGAPTSPTGWRAGEPIPV
jgi:hypothetical protein